VGGNVKEQAHGEREYSEEKIHHASANPVAVLIEPIDLGDQPLDCTIFGILFGRHDRPSRMDPRGRRCKPSRRGTAL
jgi:hypothetical protein